MTETRQRSIPTAPPHRRRWFRAIAGGALCAVLLSIVVVLAVYLLRNTLLSGIVRREVAAQLSALLDANVEIGSLGGSWITTLEIGETDIVGGAGHGLREIRGIEGTLHLDLWKLIQGDLAGLRAVDVRIQSADIDPMGRWIAASDPADAIEEDPGESTFDPWSLFGRGARVTIEHWTVGIDAPDVPPRSGGPLQLEIPASDGDRSVRILDRSKGAPLFVAARSGPSTPWTIELQLSDPGSLCVALGWNPAGLTGGSLAVRSRGDNAGDEIVVDLQATALTASGRHLEDTAARLLWRDGVLSTDRLHVQLPGITASVADARLPLLTEDPRPLLETCSGAIDLTWRHLEALQDLMPEVLAQWQPISGSLRGALRGGVVDVQELVATGTGIALSGGSFRGRVGDRMPWSGADPGAPPRDPVRVHARLVWDRPLTLPLDPEVVLGSGSAEATWTTAPYAIDGRISVRDAAGAGFEAEAIEADGRWDGELLALRRLQGDGVSPAGAGSRAHVRGSVEVGFADPEGTLDIRAALEGTADSPWWHVAAFEAGAYALAPLPFALNGALTLAPSDASIVRRGEVAVHLPEVRWNDLPQASLWVEASLREDVLEIATARVRGAVVLDASGQLANLRGDTPDFDVRSQWSIPEIGAVARAFGVEGIPGSAVGTLDLAGTASAPQITSSGSINVADLREIGRAANAAADPSDPEAELPSVGFWPEDLLGAAPSGPGRADWSMRAVDGGALLDGLSVAWGGAGDPASISVEAEGPLPAALLGDSSGQPASATPLQARLELRAAGPPEQDLPFELSAGMRSDDESVRIDDLQLRTGIGKLTGSAAASASLARCLEGDAVPITGLVQWDDLALATLPAAWLGGIPARGMVAGQFDLGGTTLAPDPQLELKFAEVSVVIPGVGRLTDLNGTIYADGGAARTDGLSGHMGRGPIALSGGVRCDHGAWWDDAAPMILDLQLTAKEALLVQRADLRLRADAALTVRGPVERFVVGGQVDITSGRLARRLTLMPDLTELSNLRFGGGAADSRGVVLFSLDPPLGDAIRFDIAIRTTHPLQVRTYVADTDLNVDLVLAGTGTLPLLVGTLQSQTGTVRFPGSRMDLESLLVTFREEDPLVPRISVIGAGRRYGYRTELTVSGSYDNPEVLLSTQPALQPADAWTLVTTGLPPSQLQTRGTMGQATLVGTYLAEEIAGWYFGGAGLDQDSKSIVDRFAIETGRDVGRGGEESVVVEFELTDNWALQAERDIYGDYNGGIVLRLRFR